MQLRANHFLESLKVMKGISSHLMMRKKINIIFRTNEMAKQNQGNPIVGRYCGSHIHMYYLKKKQYQRKQYKHKCNKQIKKIEGKAKLKNIVFWQLTPRSNKNQPWVILRCIHNHKLNLSTKWSYLLLIAIKNGFQILVHIFKQLVIDICLLIYMRNRDQSKKLPLEIK